MWFANNSISVCRGGSPSPYVLHDLLSCHDLHDDGGVPHDRDVPCGHGALRRSGACHGVRPYRNAHHDVRSDDVRPSCGDRHDRHDVRDDDRICGVCLRHGGRHGSDGPCGSDPYGISCDSRQCVRPCRDVHGGRACLPCGGDRVHDVHHGRRVHPNVFYVHHRVHDGVRHDDDCHDGRGHLYGDGDARGVLCRPYHRVRGGDARGVHGRHLLCGGDRSPPQRGPQTRRRRTLPPGKERLPLKVFS